jgi:hypothetical protein
VEVLLFRGLYKIPVLDLDGVMQIIERPYDIKGQHYSAALNKFLTCRAGFQDFKDPEDGSVGIEAGEGDCVPCHYYFDNSSGAISGPRKLHIFNAILLDYFHEIEGSQEIKGRPGSFWKEMEQCTGRRCVRCKQGVEKKFGNRVFIPLGTNFVSALADYDLVTLAESCHCGGELEPVGFSCSECGVPYRDFEENGCSNEELQSLREELHRCPTCTQRVEMEEYSDCNNCRNPKALTMWDVAMEMYRSGEGVNTSLIISKYRKVSDEEREKLRHLMTPIDTNKMYPILSLADQASKFGVDNPFGEEERRGAGAESYKKENEGKEKSTGPSLTGRQLNAINAIARSLGWTKGNLLEYVRDSYGQEIKEVEELTKADASGLIGELQKLVVEGSTVKEEEKESQEDYRDSIGGDFSDDQIPF